VGAKYCQENDFWSFPNLVFFHPGFWLNTYYFPGSQLEAEMSWLTIFKTILIIVKFDLRDNGLVSSRPAVKKACLVPRLALRPRDELRDETSITSRDYRFLKGESPIYTNPPYLATLKWGFTIFLGETRGPVYLHTSSVYR